MGYWAQYKGSSMAGWVSSKKGRKYFGARESRFLAYTAQSERLVLDALPLIPCHWCYSHSVIWGEKRWRLMAKIGHKILVGSSQTQLALFASFFLLRLLFKLARLLLCLKIRWKMLGQHIMISSLSVNFLKFWRLDYFQARLTYIFIKLL